MTEYSVVGKRLPRQDSVAKALCQGQLHDHLCVAALGGYCYLHSLQVRRRFDLSRISQVFPEHHPARPPLGQVLGAVSDQFQIQCLAQQLGAKRC